MKVIALAASLLGGLALAQGADDTWMQWSASQAEAVGKAVYVRGRVGGIFDVRLLKTERSYNYKLAATWMTPEAIRAGARLLQLRNRLTPEASRALVSEAEAAGDAVVLVEVDPREGSGVIPVDWSAFLQPIFPSDRRGEPVRGENSPKLRDVKALAGVMRRNYDYDQFWVVFPLKRADGSPVLPRDAVQAELVVRIYDKEGRVQWPIPRDLRQPSAH